MANLEQSAEQLFGVVLDLPPEQRAAFLDRACGDVPELRRMVDDLLANNDRLGSFLEQPLRHFVNETTPSGSISSPHSCLTAGTNLGHYCIIEPLGSRVAHAAGTVTLSSVFVKSKLVRMASPRRPGTQPNEDLKRELDEHLRDDEANPDERVPAEGFIADLRKKFKPIIPR
jgi:hypothetical protein